MKIREVKIFNSLFGCEGEKKFKGGLNINFRSNNFSFLEKYFSEKESFKNSSKNRVFQSWKKKPVFFNLFPEFKDLTQIISKNLTYLLFWRRLRKIILHDKIVQSELRKLFSKKSSPMMKKVEKQSVYFSRKFFNRKNSQNSQKIILKKKWIFIFFIFKEKDQIRQICRIGFSVRFFSSFLIFPKFIFRLLNDPNPHFPLLKKIWTLKTWNPYYLNATRDREKNHWLGRNTRKESLIPSFQNNFQKAREKIGISQNM